jgi:hypothetical protein
MDGDYEVGIVGRHNHSDQIPSYVSKLALATTRISVDLQRT